MIVYREFIDHFFYSDDFIWIHYGEEVKRNFINVLRLKVTSFYSPVVNFYFFIGQIFFPNNHQAYHLLGIFIHIINSFLIYLIVNKILKHKGAAIISALFFSVSFYHFEAIIWISAVMHLLVTFFVLLGIWFYLKYHETRKLRFVIFSCLSGALAFFTKENGIVFGAMVFCLFFYLNCEKKWKIKKWLPILPFAFMILFFFVYSYLQQRNSFWVSIGVYKISYKAVYQMFVSLIGLIDINLAKLVMPRIRNMLMFFGSFSLLLFLLSLYKRKEVRPIFLGIILSILGFAPVMFFYFGTWRNISQYRYAYLPTIGASLAVGGFYLIITSLKNKWYKRITVYLFFLIFIANLGYNALLVHKVYQKQYFQIDKQMRKMVQSFIILETELTNQKNIILLGNHPFSGNEYYRFMYRHFIDPGKNKEISDWLNVANTAENIEKYSDSKYYLIVWNSKTMEIEKLNN